MTDAAPPPPPPPAPPPYAPPPTPTAVERPGIVTGAGIVLIVVGVLTVLFGIFALIAFAAVTGAASSGSLNMPGLEMVAAFAGAAYVLIGVFIVWGVLEVLSGINVLSGRSWARILGLILAILGALFSLPGLFGGGQDAGSPILSVVFLVCYLFIIWALATSGSWFAARST